MNMMNTFTFFFLSKQVNRVQLSFLIRMSNLNPHNHYSIVFSYTTFDFLYKKQTDTYFFIS